jgi:hypothetical protein
VKERWERTFGLEAPVWRFIALIVCIAVAIALLVTLLCDCDGSPSPNELCRDHGGVANVGGGGWATPLVATCRDGYSGKVAP